MVASGAASVRLLGPLSGNNFFVSFFDSSEFALSATSTSQIEDFSKFGNQSGF